MSRVLTMARFLSGDLFRSLSGVASLAAALAFGLIAFEYGMDQAQFITVGGVGLGAIGFLTTLLLAGRAARASSYALMGRLHRRTELLVALLAAGMGITLGQAVCITAGNLAGDRLSLDGWSAAWIAPTWLLLWLLTTALALPLASLTSRAGSHLAGYVVLVGLLVVNDDPSWFARHRLGLLVEVVQWVVWPVRTLLSHASAGVHDSAYWAAGALTLGCAVALFVLAAWLFERKDLLWTE